LKEANRIVAPIFEATPVASFPILPN